MSLLAEGRVVDLLLVVVAAEVALLALARRLLGVGPTPADMLGAVLPGVALMMALRAALTGGSEAAVLGWLAAAFPLHLIDLHRRWSAAKTLRGKVPELGGRPTGPS